MKKPASLREALTTSLDPRHHISKNPDRLLMACTNVVTLASARPGGGFEYRYTLELTFLDFAGDAVEITVPLLVWIQRWQHDMLASPEAAAKGMDMSVEILSSEKADIHVALQLTETVLFVPRPAGEGPGDPGNPGGPGGEPGPGAGSGAYDVVFQEPRVPMALQGGSPLHAVYLDGELILHCTAHPDLGV